MASRVRLGVNIDHVATVRNARGVAHPDPVRAALLAQEAGVDGITAHLREDRRHIVDSDIARLMEAARLPLNLEMAATPEMQALALQWRPHAVCLVPEKRAERTTEGGLDVVAQRMILKDYVRPLADAGIRVSLFINPAADQVDAAKDVGAHVVELHTGRYCDLQGSTEDPSLPGSEYELMQIRQAATQAAALGLECHAGHGLSFDTVGPIAAIQEIAELNIGHFLIGEAIFTGLGESIRRMRQLMDGAR